MNALHTLIMDLIRFPSTHDRMEEIHRCMEFCKQYVQNVPDVRVQSFVSHNYPSALLTRGTDTPQILLHGHIDVVGENGERQYEPYIEGDRLYGRGSLDMKSGVAIALYLLRHWDGVDPCPFGVLITPDEEIGSAHGAAYVFNECGVTCDAFITLEGDPKFALFHREKGMFCLRLTAKGRSGHASKPWLSENAIDKILGCIAELRPHFPNEENAWSDTMSVTTVRGQSTGINVVPDAASAIIDIRFTRERDIVQQLIADAASLWDCEVSYQLSCPKVDTPLNTPYAKALVQAFTEVVGSNAEVTYMHGASDARFPADKGIASFILGPQGEGHHGPTEWVSIKSVEAVYETLARFVKQIS